MHKNVVIFSLVLSFKINEKKTREKAKFIGKTMLQGPMAFYLKIRSQKS